MGLVLLVGMREASLFVFFETTLELNETQLFAAISKSANLMVLTVNRAKRAKIAMV